MDGGAAVQAGGTGASEVSGAATDRDGILRACELQSWETRSQILRLGYCLIYCLFSGPTRGYLVDSIDWIDRALGM